MPSRPGYTVTAWRSGILVGTVVLPLLLASLLGSDLVSHILSPSGGPRRYEAEGAPVALRQEVWVDPTFPAAGLEKGFADREADGTWVSGGLASLRFRTPEGTSPRILALAIFPFTTDRIPIREVEIRTSMGATRFDLQSGGQVIEVEVDGSEKQLVTIRCQPIGSPAELGIGADVRNLCLKLMWFQVA